MLGELETCNALIRLTFQTCFLPVLMSSETGVMRDPLSETHWQPAHGICIFSYCFAGDWGSLLVPGLPGSLFIWQIQELDLLLRELMCLWSGLSPESSEKHTHTMPDLSPGWKNLIAEGVWPIDNSYPTNEMSVSRCGSGYGYAQVFASVMVWERGGNVTLWHWHGVCVCLGKGI